MVKSVLLHAYEVDPIVRFVDLPNYVRASLSPDNFENLDTINWYTTTVKLDMETHQIMERIPGSKTQTLRLVSQMDVHYPDCERGELMFVRCSWVGNDPLSIAYHDEEWGLPVHDDRKHFEFMILDAFQAGLSWAIIMKKREGFLPPALSLYLP